MNVLVRIRRMKGLPWLLSGAIVLGGAVLAVPDRAIAAEGGNKPSTKKASAKRVTKPGTHELYGIAWYPDGKAALAAAEKKPERLVYCLRVLGDLDGFM